MSYALPKWTKRVITDMGGRDPLGLSRVAFLITDYLLTGIITTTDRARYYSFYCWALWHIQQEEKPKKYQEFLDAFRRREAAMALATIANNPATSPVGVEATRIYFSRGKETGQFDCDFKVLPSNPLGGYGQYYAGSIYHLSLSHRPEDFIDRVTEGTAEKLAEAYHETIEHTPYIKKGLFRDTDISVKDLSNSKEFLTLDALNEPFAREERKKLIEIFFGLDGQPEDEKTILRRQTLIQILHLISEYEKNDYLPNSEKTVTLDECLLYPLYYGVLWPEDDETLAYTALKSFSFNCSMWKQFCLHQFLAQAVEGLMRGVLEVVSSVSGGLTLGEVISRLIQPEFFSVMKKITGSDCATPSTLLSNLGISGLPDNKTSLDLQKKLKPSHPLSEAQLLRLNDSSPEAIFAKAILLLGVIYGKWRGVAYDQALHHVKSKAGDELWAGKVLPELDIWLDTETTWADSLEFLIELFVLEQHDRIMYEKRRLDSCWLHRAEGKIFKDQDYHPVWRASRFLNSIKIMADLGLINISKEKNLSLTKQGQALIERMAG
ncbi:MAG: hypothetical protein LC803_01590 [Acidobacteria bacterium]|nr:hypothetical protein [Acidobacteriota bacterium]